MIFFKKYIWPVDNQEEVNLTEIIAGIENKKARELNLIDESNFRRLKRNDIESKLLVMPYGRYKLKKIRELDL